jgi:hypothetical protein
MARMWSSWARGADTTGTDNAQAVGVETSSIRGSGNGDGGAGVATGATPAGDNVECWVTCLTTAIKGYRDNPGDDHSVPIPLGLFGSLLYWRRIKEMLFWKSGFKTISLGYAHTCNNGSVVHWFNRTGILIRTFRADRFPSLRLTHLGSQTLPRRISSRKILPLINLNQQIS